MNLNKIILISILSLSLFGLYCSLIIGISWDEPSSNFYSLSKINFLKTFGENKEYLKYHNFSVETHNPGFYSTILAFFSNLFPKNLIYETRHLLNFFISCLTLVGVYLSVKENFDKRLGLFTVLFCLLNPFFFGLMAITVRDMPICFAYVWTIYFFSKYIQNFSGNRIKYSILLGLIIGFGLGVRIVFLLNLFPLLIIFILFLIFSGNETKKFAQIKKIFTDLVIIIFLSLLILFSFWVPAYHEPFQTLISTFLQSLIPSGAESGGLVLGPPTDIINGEIYEASKTPRSYLLTFFLSRFPIFSIILFTLFFLIYFFDRKFLLEKYKNFNIKIFSILFLLAFPIFLLVAFQIKLYDGIRLIIFLVPFFSLILAIGFNYFLEKFREHKINQIALVIVIFTFFLFFERYLRLTPYQYDFSNYSSVSFKNSQNLYQHDFWATSYKELINKIKDERKFNNKKFSVSVCGGDIWQAVNEFAKDKQFRNNVSFYHSFVNYEADYILMINRLGIGKYQNTKCFDRFKGENVYSVERLGITYSVFRKIINE